jgi:hypothetical protein
MARGGIAWWKTLTEARAQELLTLYRDRTIGVEQIAKEFNISKQQISQFANLRGIRRLDPYKKGGKAGTLPRSTTLTAVERRLEDAARREEALRFEIEVLRARRAELALRFELEGDMVLVWGVAGGGPLRATATEWLQFLNLEGGRKLREFIAAHVGKAVRP